MPLFRSTSSLNASHADRSSEPIRYGSAGPLPSIRLYDSAAGSVIRVADARRVRSGSPFEQEYGFCRALRVGSSALVAGTAPIWPDGAVDPDAGVQMRRCLEIVQAALTELGARLEDVVRTRMFIVDLSDARAVGAVHGELFAARPPVATMVVVAGLLDPRWRVELEVDATIPQEAIG